MARAMCNQHDPIVITLNAMAAEFDAEAAAIEARVAMLHLIGHDDDVSPKREQTNELLDTGRLHSSSANTSRR